MKIATSFTDISVGLVCLAFMEYASSICHDFYTLKELDGVYFEIWKRVTKQQRSFEDALKEVYKLNKFPLCQGLLAYWLHYDCSHWETQVPEDKAVELIATTLKKMYKKTKGYEQYARKKLKIAELLGWLEQR
ncbi:uncharacterized protein LOC133887860 isoform X2 [Phragmites australis]|uniref:uncharacterized protein LOC133887860 isoform X2 n=1 Tax=Phragmites australis TaxID=29695 RepID=UPI002D768233|nr:uncharacterized protein LOC133887860 isoform X2 [Phragmites australis]